MKIEQRDLEYFAVVAKYGNLGRAAEALDLSQPALSMSLKRLELATGSKIVGRTAKGVELTEAGRTLLKHISRLRLAHEDILKEVSDIGRAQAGHIRVGTSVGISDIRLASACAVLLNEAPRVTLYIETVSNQPKLLQQLRAGELDFVLTTAVGPDAEDLHQEPMIDDEFVVYCSRRHPLVQEKRITCANLVGARWVSTEWDSQSARRLRTALEQRGLPPPRVALTSVHPEFRLRVVAATNLLGHNSRAVVQEAAKRLPLIALRLEDWNDVRRSSAIIYRKDAYLSPAARRLIDLVKSTVRAPE